jgi:hypothetical protein
MQGEMQTYRGSCHCGKVRFEIQSTLDPAVRCNCSLCSRKGTVMTRVPVERFALLAGEEYLTLYQFNTKIAKHYFCKVCGIYTFHRPRTAPDLYGINIGCLDGVDAHLLQVGLNDGRGFSTVLKEQTT